MQVQAVSVGEAVPRPYFDAVIQSCFDSAVNLRLQDADRLVTVLVSDHYDLPQGIRIAPSTAPIQDLIVGQSATGRGYILSFESSPLTIDLRKASIWKCRVSQLHADFRWHAAASAWSTAWRLLNARQQGENAEVVASDLLEEGSGSILSRKLSAAVVELISAAARFDVETSSVAAERVIGLGGGVTPSGDDILVGFLAGMWSTAGGDERRLSYVHQLGDPLMLMAAGTTEISRTYLLHAVQGQFSSSLSSLARAIATGDHVAGPAEEAFRVGHSSGMDSVTGLLLGLAVWSPEIVAQLVPLS